MEMPGLVLVMMGIAFALLIFFLVSSHPERDWERAWVDETYRRLLSRPGIQVFRGKTWLIILEEPEGLALAFGTPAEKYASSVDHYRIWCLRPTKSGQPFVWAGMHIPADGGFDSLQAATRKAYKWRNKLPPKMTLRELWDNEIPSQVDVLGPEAFRHV